LLASPLFGSPLDRPRLCHSWGSNGVLRGCVGAGGGGIVARCERAPSRPVGGTHLLGVLDWSSDLGLISARLLRPIPLQLQPYNTALQPRTAQPHEWHAPTPACATCVSAGMPPSRPGTGKDAPCGRARQRTRSGASRGTRWSTLTRCCFERCSRQLPTRGRSRTRLARPRGWSC